MLEHTKLRHFWAQIASWAPIRAQKTFYSHALGLYFTYNTLQELDGLVHSTRGESAIVSEFKFVKARDVSKSS